MLEKKSQTELSKDNAIRLAKYMATDIDCTLKEHDRDISALAAKNKKTLNENAGRLVTLGIFSEHEEPPVADMTLEERLDLMNKIQILDSGEPLTPTDIWLTRQGDVLVRVIQWHGTKSEYFREATDLEYVALHNRILNAVGILSLEALPSNT